LDHRKTVGVTAQSSAGEIATELAARRTGMSFQRTRLSADRTLMSVIRTSLSLIGFGFTIFQFFEKLKETGTLTHPEAPRNFGLSLVFLGVGMLVVGIVFHILFMLGLRAQRHEMAETGLIHAQSMFPTSYTLVVAVLLLAVGVMAIVSMIFDVWPFG
jgi:putative membrane protein